MKPKNNHFLLSRLSIQQRLPLLICTLLLASIIIYGFANYYSLKKATLILAKERLSSLTDQLNASFGQVTRAFATGAKNAAVQKSVIQYLKSGGKEFGKETLDEANKLDRDSTWVLVELLNKDMAPVLRSTKSTMNIGLNLKEVILNANVGPDSAVSGKLYKIKGGAVYPVIAAVTDKKQVIGYFIAWKSVLTTAKAVQQLAQFVGSGSSFYIGNEDGSLWTNFIKPLDKAPFKVGRLPASIQFTDPDEGVMIGEVRLIANTRLSTAVSMSERTVLKGVASFVNWIIAIGIVLLTIGITMAWVMSRRITRPLNQLIAAATAISQGNYSTPVPIEIYQNDELGKLAGAFNIMIEQVFRMHNDLEDKVEERTSQLENVNKELEAFSYSVSHDLRTPLRAINGYSIMLKEDYGDELDTEGKRIIRNIITNAKMMGQLIDDLLAFSRLGKKELVRSRVDMQLVAESVVSELLLHEPEDKYHISIDPLPVVEADPVMIRQVLMNVVGNAIKYSSKKDKPEIAIGCDDETNRTVFLIKDNGAGFDMAYADKLFGVFQRLHSQEEFDGTGVGLALVKRIIDKHKGEVWAQGLENIGATFYFSIPKR